MRSSGAVARRSEDALLGVDLAVFALRSLQLGISKGAWHRLFGKLPAFGLLGSRMVWMQRRHCSASLPKRGPVLQRKSTDFFVYVVGPSTLDDPVCMVISCRGHLSQFTFALLPLTDIGA